jgi:hypothetical protein
MRPPPWIRTFDEIVGGLDMTGTLLDVTHIPCGSAMVLRKERQGTYAVACPVCCPERDDRDGGSRRRGREVGARGPRG